MVNLSSTSDETGCGISIPDGSSTVRVAAEHTSNFKPSGVKISPVIYHYESMESEGKPNSANNHRTVAKEKGDDTAPPCKTAKGGVDKSHGT